MLSLLGERVPCVYLMGSGVKDYWASAHRKHFIISTSLKWLFLRPVPFLHTWDICGAIVPHGWDFCVLRAAVIRSASSFKSRPGITMLSEEREYPLEC